MTPRQAELLRFISIYWMEHGCAPLVTEMQDALGLASKSGVKRLVDGLIERGYLARKPYVCRGLTIVRWPRGPKGTEDVFYFDPAIQGFVALGRRPTEKPPAPARGRAAWTGESVSKDSTQGEVVGTAPVHDQRNKG